MTDDGQRITACLMASGGLRPKDIAEAMGVSERQVLDWLTPQSLVNTGDNK